jgi:hypothetical protein
MLRDEQLVARLSLETEAVTISRAVEGPSLSRATGTGWEAYYRASSARNASGSVDSPSAVELWPSVLARGA